MFTALLISPFFTFVVLEKTLEFGDSPATAFGGISHQSLM
jgi:hypothetical protein